MCLRRRMQGEDFQWRRQLTRTRCPARMCTIMSLILEPSVVAADQRDWQYEVTWKRTQYRPVSRTRPWRRKTEEIPKKDQKLNWWVSSWIAFKVSEDCWSPFIEEVLKGALPAMILSVEGVLDSSRMLSALAANWSIGVVSTRRTSADTREKKSCLMKAWVVCKLS